MAAAFQQGSLKWILKWRKRMAIVIDERTRDGESSERACDQLIETGLQGQASRGRVFLVGAGPGDPELITLKGLRCLHKADVVVFDRLICPDLLDEVPPQAQRVFVGK